MRNKLDRYNSPFWYATYLQEEIDFYGNIFEPCNGGGNLSRVLAKIPHTRVITNDIDLEEEADFHLDASEPCSWEYLPDCNWVVTNPPFSDAFPILKNAYQKATGGVVMFLRQSFAEPTGDRAMWLYEHPPHVVYVYPRFKFKMNDKGRWQTDTSTIAAFVWIKFAKPPRRSGLISVPKSLIKDYYDNPDKEPIEP